MRFVAIDVETANANLASICAIGLAVFENNNLTEEWYSLIDPDDYFSPLNVSIHGVSESQVRGKPKFVDIFRELDQLIGASVIVTHTHFDRTAIHQALSRSAISTPNYRWLDSARVARRTWAQFARSGYGLANVCKLIGYSFQHHNALEDAKAAGQIILAASRESGLDMEALLDRVNRPVDLNSVGTGSTKRVGDPNAPLAGEVVVFTGELLIPRSVAADLAASAGCDVKDNVTKATTLLVVGDIDVSRLAGHKKTSKHRKAEELISQGHPIRIIRETDFNRLVQLT